MSLIVLRASRRFALLLGAAHGLAMAAVMTLPLGALERVVAVLALALAGVASVRRHALLRDRRAVVKLQARDDGWWDLQAADGQWREARLALPCFVSAPLTVLRFHYVDGRDGATVVMMADSTDAADYRRLRMQLGWKPQVPSA